jgi:integrating conjugative element protein (TIGR03749 family)
MFRLYILIFVWLISVDTFADPLLLTPQEMQKLKQYFPEEENTHLVWKGEVLQMTLTLNQEKRLIFSSNVTPDLKGALMTDQLDIINDNKSLYLTAKKPFSHVRMFVSLENTNQVILMDLSTQEKGNKEENNTVYIDLPRLSSQETTQSNNNETLSISNNDNAVTLVRYAWQQLFAPVRLLENPLNISRAPMHTTYFVSSLVNGDKVIAHPIASWVYQNTYVTAIELRNKYPHPTSIDIPKDLCGDWKAASLYVPENKQKNEKDEKNQQDQHFLFLISNKPFGDSLEYCHGSA